MRARMIRVGETMGLLDEISSLTGSNTAQDARASRPQVANGLVQALQEHPGGIANRQRCKRPAQ
jgi:hypothetical protein